MGIAAGTRLGPYEITAPLGAGGMGEVYRARDTRLDRFVAIKVLPAALAVDHEFRERLEREARTIARLNDPRICALHDVGDQDGVAYLVMEYLEGVTLAARLERGPLPIKEALARAIEVAGALDRAHRAGIVHRDLKPGNVMVTKSGTKLLDFGLAKTTPALAGLSGQSADVTEHDRVRTPAADPTVAPPLTVQGTILGTFLYMSPEQLEGKEVDARADIWAFGCVLYEMIAGRRPFAADSHVRLIGAILRDDPPAPSSLQPRLPVALDRIAAACLAKDPDDRWQSAADIAKALALVADGSLAEPARAPWAAGTAEWRRWMLTGAFAIATLVLSALIFFRPEPTPTLTRASILPPDGSEFVSTWIDAGPVEISPDGTRLVFVARKGEGPNQLWVRMLSESSARPLAGTDGARRPFWSPDGRFIGFFTDRGLKKIDVNGGPVFSLADAGDSRGGTWNRDGVILFTPDARGPVFRVSADGGQVTPATVVGPNDATHRYARFLPDGKHFLYLVRKSGAGAGPEPAVMVGSLDSKESTLVVNVASNAVYASGYLLYVREGALVAQRFDPDTLTLGGEPGTIAPDVRMDERFSRGVFSASDNGVLVYHTGKAATMSTLRWFDRDGTARGTVGEPAQFFNGGDPEISPDGTRATASIVDLRTGISDVWMIDLSSGTRHRFTAGLGDKQAALWSRDGSRIAYTVSQSAGSGYDIVSKPVAGSGSVETLLSDPVQYPQPRGFSPDGRFLLYQSRNPAGRDDLGLLPLSPRTESRGERKPQTVSATPALELSGQFSPDGRFIAYSSDESGRFEIYVVAFPGTGRQWQVSQNGGIEPRWRKDGKELFFFALDNRLMAAPVNAGGGRFEVGAIQSLFQTRTMGSGFRYDVSKDGTKFLVTTGLAEELSPITLVSNWTEALKRK